MKSVASIIAKFGLMPAFPPTITVAEENKITAIVHEIWFDPFARPLIKAILDSPRPLSLFILKKLAATSDEGIMLALTHLAQRQIIVLKGEDPHITAHQNLSPREQALLSAYLLYSDFFVDLAKEEFRLVRQRMIGKNKPLEIADPLNYSNV